MSRRAWEGVWKSEEGFGRGVGVRAAVQAGVRTRATHAAMGRRRRFGRCVRNSRASRMSGATVRSSLVEGAGVHSSLAEGA